VYKPYIADKGKGGLVVKWGTRPQEEELRVSVFPKEVFPMKRALVLLCVLGLVLAVAISAEAKKEPPKPKPVKVLIAHVEEVIEDFVDPTGVVGTLTLYHVISVSDRSLKAHEAHGDIIPAPDGYSKCDRFEIFEPYP
jgi:hypothetical protein